MFASELGEFVDLQSIAYWADGYTSIFAFIVFCATLKFIKLLRFNKRIGLLSMTLRHALRDLIGFSCVFLIVFFAFSLFGVAVFGDRVKGYRDMMHSFASLFKFILGVVSLKDLQSADYFFGSVFFLLFYTIVVMGLMTMFVTILNEAFAKAKADLDNMENEHEFVDYIFSKLKKIAKKGVKKKKPIINNVNNLDASMISLRVNVNDSLNARKWTAQDSSKKSYNSMSLFGHTQVAPLGYENDSMSLF